jgi:uncharacterized damage-inducible protein DinB
MASTSEDPRYPIGAYHPPSNIDASHRWAWIESISQLPGELSSVVRGLSDQQLGTPYREGGWTVRQLVHHVADSHQNSHIRFRLALTEDVPLIKPYNEKLWAELPDAKQLPVDCSLQLLDGLHRRWTDLLRHMTEADFKRRLVHPESGELTLGWLLGLYAWHGRHHVAHISRLKDRMSW